MAPRATHDTALLRILAAAGYTQASFAKRVGMDRQQIHKWFAQGRPIPPEIAQRFAPLLRVQAADLVFAHTHGLAETAAPLAPPAVPQPDMDEAFGHIQEAVAIALAAEHLPRTQADIARVSRIVEREMILLGRMNNFEDGLGLTLSEVLSKLKRKWQEALGSS